MKVFRFFPTILLICLLGISFSICPSFRASQIDSKTISVGVLAKQGKASCFEKWRPIVEYLEKATGYTMQLLCLDFEKVPAVVQKKPMKAFSHPGSNEKKQTDLNELLKTTLTVARNEWKYVADFDLQLDETLPTVFCMHNEMGQVFLNILINAAHAISEKISKKS